MKIKKVIMALLDKISPSKEPQQEVLTIQELEFIQKKLRSAPYIGEEFEQFYNIYVKIIKEIERRK